MPKSCLFVAIIIGVLNLNWSLLVIGQEDREPRCKWTSCDRVASCDADSDYPYKWATGRNCDSSGSTCNSGEFTTYCCEVPSPYFRTYITCGAGCDNCNDKDVCIVDNIPCNPSSSISCIFSGSSVLCGEEHPLESLRRTPWYWFVIGAVVLLVGGLLGVAGGTYICCVKGNCCSDP